MSDLPTALRAYDRTRLHGRSQAESGSLIAGRVNPTKRVATWNWSSRRELGAAFARLRDQAVAFLDAGPCAHLVEEVAGLAERLVCVGIAEGGEAAALAE